MKWFLILTVLNPAIPVDVEGRMEMREWPQTSQAICEANVERIEITLAAELQAVLDEGMSYILTCEDR